MEPNNQRPAQGREPLSAAGGPQSTTGGSSNGIEASDWRSHDARQRIVEKIMETLKRILPVDGPNGLSELRNIAARFEEKVYTGATSQSDYLRKISLKMLTMMPVDETPDSDEEEDHYEPNDAKVFADEEEDHYEPNDAKVDTREE